MSRCEPAYHRHCSSAPAQRVLVAGFSAADRNRDQSPIRSVGSRVQHCWRASLIRSQLLCRYIMTLYDTASSTRSIRVVCIPRGDSLAQTPFLYDFLTTSAFRGTHNATSPDPREFYWLSLLTVLAKVNGATALTSTGQGSPVARCLVLDPVVSVWASTADGLSCQLAAACLLPDCLPS